MSIHFSYRPDNPPCGAISVHELVGPFCSICHPPRRLLVRCQSTSTPQLVLTSPCTLQVRGDKAVSRISIKYSSRTEMNRSLCINMQLMIIFLLCLISAGVGRTGTYIALDLMIEHARHESKVSFFKTVKRLRDDRCSMVQNKVGTTPLYCH